LSAVVITLSIIVLLIGGFVYLILFLASVTQISSPARCDCSSIKRINLVSDFRTQLERRGKQNTHKKKHKKEKAKEIGMK